MINDSDDKATTESERDKARGTMRKEKSLRSMVHQTTSAKEARSTNTEHSPRHIDHRIIATSRGKDPQVECPLDSLKWQLKKHQNKNKK
ncbi:hypothetical protein TIFTF001_004472 [Ficus carica]|uniref:Uncharacterized protein n=1 Tax=Ficus carica TaxID=3494 RepID=A0AA87ZGD2_FICCA|nr:hypothetical protein TIFTF001_004472 [Ficus carica]